MKVTYIFHSCFLVETEDCYYLFDYYKGELPRLKSQKPILVFSSHNHADHYNKAVFDRLREQGMENVTAVLSKDIPPRKHPEGIPVIRVYCHKEYALPCGTTLRTLLSTDEGVAFLLRCSEGCIYHAGDLNDWVWAEETDSYNRQMTGSYRHEIDLLKDEKIDIAFVPLDPRQEKDAARGILYFLEHVSVKQVFPMHYWEQPQCIDEFCWDYPMYRESICRTPEYL